VGAGAGTAAIAGVIVSAAVVSVRMVGVGTLGATSCSGADGDPPSPAVD
jgi:hypothetical protein